MFPLTSNEAYIKSTGERSTLGRMLEEAGNSPEIVTNTKGTAYKFPSGLMICTKQVTFENLAITTAWGSLYESDRVSFGDWPVAFKDTPVYVSATNMGGQGCWCEYVVGTTASVAGGTNLVRPTSNTSTVLFSVVGIGKWK